MSHFLDRRFLVEQCSSRADTLRGGVTQHVNAQQRSRFAMTQHLGETGSVAGRHCLAQVPDGEVPDRDRNSLFPGCLLGQTDGPDFRERVHGPGDRRRVKRLVAQGIRNRHHALLGSGMGQQAATVGIADAIDSRNIGLHLVVDLNETARAELDPHGFQSDPLRFGTPSHRDQDPFRFQGVPIGKNGLAARLRQRQFVHTGSGENFDSALRKDLAQFRPQLLIHFGQQTRHQFNHRHLHPHGLKQTGELAPDHAPSHDEQAGGQCFPVQRLVAGTDPFAILGPAGNASGFGPDGQNDLLRLNRLGFTRVLARRTRDGQLSRPAQDRLAIDKRYAAIGEQVANARAQLAQNLILAFLDRGPVGGGFPFYQNAESRSARDVVQ